MHCGIRGVSDLSPIAEGIENTNYMMTSAGGARHILTVFEVWNADMAAYYADLMRHLAAGGAPVPAPLKPDAQNKDASIGDWNGKPCLIAPFVEGESISDPDAEACRKMGDAVARLHRAAADFMPQMPNPRDAGWRRKTAESVRPLLRPGQQDLLDAALRTDAETECLPLPAAACHCDLFRNNVLWDGGEIAGVIDFYFGGDDTLIFDLAVCACDWCFADGRFDEKLMSALLEGYESRRPLCDLERAHFHHALQIAALRFWISRLYDMHFPRRAAILTPHNPERFEEILRSAQGQPPLPFPALGMPATA